MKREHPSSEEFNLVEKQSIQDVQPSKVSLNPTPERRQWTRQLDFTLSVIGYCVGLSNIWRFPYLCNRNGGGAFLIPYLMFLFLVGMPIFFLEISIGQFSGRSALNVWNMCPLFKGIGFVMTICSGILSLYYNLIIAWALFYLVRSFAAVLPWSTCGNWWNTKYCYEQGQNNTNVNGSHVIGPVNNTVTYNLDTSKRFTNQSRSAAEEFWQFNTLRISPGLDVVGDVQWHLAVSLLGAWVLVFLCLIKGVKSIGKVVYVTAVLPYILLTVILIKAVTLPGAANGIIYYLKPDFSRLLEIQVWLEAMLQILYSVGITWGGFISMASCNRFNNNCLRDSVLITFIGEGTSIYAGLAVFSVLGFMADQRGVHISEVVKAGPGLGFVAYPEALSQLPVPQMWAILFFLMLIAIGLDSEFGTMETVIMAILETFPNSLAKKRVLVTAGSCVLAYLMGLPLTCQGGIYIFQLIDWYSATFGLLFVGLLECVVMGWIYGVERFGDDIELMLGRRPPCFMKILWCFISPICILAAIIFTILKYKPPTYGDYHYPAYAQVIGWIFATVSILPVPIIMIREILKRKGTLWQKIRLAVSPEPSWCPISLDHREEFIQNQKRSRRRFFKRNSR